jgi:colanic acid biosynthesis glycosyl transferase WcaI
MYIIFVNRYFHPDHSATSQMLSDLAFALAEHGRRIAVVTSRQLYDSPGTRLPSYQTVSDVEIHRVWTSRFGRQNLAGRVIDYLTFYLSSAWTLWRLAHRGDVIVAKTDPPMLSVVVGLVAKIRRAHLINWLQDLFPEVLEALDVGRKSRRVAYNAMRTLRNRSLRQARLNIVIGERMADKLARLDVPPKHIRIIQNWADGALVQPRVEAISALRRAWDLEGKFVVGYSGNLGRAHEFDTLIEAIARLEKARDSSLGGKDTTSITNCGRPTATAADAPPPARHVIWLFIGGGALYGQLQSEVAARGLTSVHFRPYQPREQLTESLSVPDVHLVSLRPELEGLIVPSKYYGIAAAGRTAIFVGDEDGEIARLLRADNVGWTVAPNDSARLAALILELAANPVLTQAMGHRARSAFERGFNLPVAVAAWEKALAEVQPALSR